MRMMSRSCRSSRLLLCFINNLKGPAVRVRVCVWGWVSESSLTWSAEVAKTHNCSVKAHQLTGLTSFFLHYVSLFILSFSSEFSKRHWFIFFVCWLKIKSIHKSDLHDAALHLDTFLYIAAAPRHRLYRLGSGLYLFWVEDQIRQGWLSTRNFHSLLTWHIDALWFDPFVALLAGT